MRLYIAPDGLSRCGWVEGVPEFLAYHDDEWGFPVSDDLRLFEKVSLEAFQSGLSWRTILTKRENFRRAFAGFDYHAVAGFGDEDRDRLLSDSGIVRHRGKIDAVINNAQRAVELEGEFRTLAAYFWGFEPRVLESEVPQSRSTTPESVALSKDLKNRGWKFVGPTTAFAFMQAMGLVNDHLVECVVHGRVQHARGGFVKPRRSGER
jgi:DNA-3-methyladenine glycosylase I